MAKVFEAHGTEFPFKKGSAVNFEVGLVMEDHMPNKHLESQEMAASPRFLCQAS